MNELKLKKLLHAIAYFALVFLAIALVLKQISRGDLFVGIADVLKMLADLAAYTLIGISAFFYVKTKRNLIYMITYVVAVIAVVMFVILPLF